jgi:hypothetical protein
LAAGASWADACRPSASKHTSMMTCLMGRNGSQQDFANSYQPTAKS